MDPYLKDPDLILYRGDAFDVLSELEPESIDCCVTSPPYWRLRDYGEEDQLGLEADHQQYVRRLVEVFRRVRSVLTARGTLWLNLGDTYSCSHKNMCGIPWRTAFALQEDGWYLRSDIIWSKANPMPESVTDRPTKSHEYIFLLSKNQNYYFDQEAVREPFSEKWKSVWEKHPKNPLVSNPDSPYRIQGNTRGGGVGYPEDADGRNIRTVWEMPSQPYPGAHFAPFPEELARRCILAGSPEKGVVLDPFAGSGTTAVAARKQNRRSVLIELNPSYCELIRKRTEQQSLFAEV